MTNIEMRQERAALVREMVTLSNSSDASSQNRWRQLDPKKVCASRLNNPSARVLLTRKWIRSATLNARPWRQRARSSTHPHPC